jgi:hypothetical protein
MSIRRKILDRTALSEKEHELIMLKLSGNEKLVFELTLEG